MSVKMLTLGGTKRGLDVTAVDGLRSRMRGPLLTSADAGYDEARRIWNTRDRWEAVRPWSSGAVYMNALSDDEGARVCAMRMAPTTRASWR